MGSSILLIGGAGTVHSILRGVIDAPCGAITWTRAPHDLEGARSMFSCCVHKGSVICIDSDQIDTSGTAESVDMTTFVSTPFPVPSASNNLHRPTVASFGTNLYLTGGKTIAGKENDYEPSRFVFTLDAAGWTQHPAALKTARINHASVAFDGALWVAGGSRTDIPGTPAATTSGPGAGPLASVEVYDQVTKHPILSRIRHPLPDRNHCLTHLMQVTGAWRHAGSMNKARESFHLVGKTGKIIFCCHAHLPAPPTSNARHVPHATSLCGAAVRRRRRRRPRLNTHRGSVGPRDGPVGPGAPLTPLDEQCKRGTQARQPTSPPPTPHPPRPPAGCSAAGGPGRLRRGRRGRGDFPLRGRGRRRVTRAVDHVGRILPLGGDVGVGEPAGGGAGPAAPLRPRRGSGGGVI